MCPCICACMHLCIYISMYPCIYVHTYVSMHLCVYVSMYLCIYASMYLRVCVSMYLSVYVSMCLCIYVCLRIYVRSTSIYMCLLCIDPCNNSNDGVKTTIKFVTSPLSMTVCDVEIGPHHQIIYVICNMKFGAKSNM